MAKVIASVPAYNGSWGIKVLVATNPKKVGSKCYLKFDPFFVAATVAEFADLMGKGWRSEIKWCVERGYVELIPPADAPVEAEVAAEAE